jgi:hypothetical protein
MLSASRQSTGMGVSPIPMSDYISFFAFFAPIYDPKFCVRVLQRIDMLYLKDVALKQKREMKKRSE